MPLDLIAIERIDPVQTANPRVTAFLITGEAMDVPRRHIQVETINEWKASICQRAKDAGQMVWVGWKDGRCRSKEIVTVKLDDTKFQHDEAV